MKASKKKLESLRKWKLAHPEKVKACNHRYSLKTIEKRRLYRLANKEKIQQNRHLHHLLNIEKIRETNRLYRLNNREKIKKQKHEYYLVWKTTLKASQKLSDKEAIRSLSDRYVRRLVKRSLSRATSVPSNNVIIPQKMIEAHRQFISLKKLIKERRCLYA